MFAGGLRPDGEPVRAAAAITESPLGSHVFVCAVPGGWSPLPGAERLLFLRYWDSLRFRSQNASY